MANTLETRLVELAVEFGTKAKALNVLLNGNATDLSSLNTSAKANLVAAINEIQAAVAAAAESGGAALNDAAASTSTVYSSSKVLDLLAGLKADLLGGASGAYDTLKELQDALAADDTEIGALVTSIGTKVSFTENQTLTAGQQAQALSNIGAVSAASLGDVTRDFAADFTNAAS